MARLPAATAAGTPEPAFWVHHLQQSLLLIRDAWRVLLRARRVWVLMAVFVALQVLNLPLFPPRANGGQLQGMGIGIRERLLQGALDFGKRWGDATSWGRNVADRMQDPLGWTLAAVVGSVTRLTELTSWGQSTNRMAMAALVLSLNLFFAAVEAFLTGGVYGWLRAAAERRQLSGRLFLRSSGSHFIALFAVLGLLHAASVGLSYAFPDHANGQEGSHLAASAWKLLTVPLALTAFTIVGRDVGAVRGVKEALGLFRRHWGSLLGVWLGYLVAREVYQWVGLIAGWDLRVLLMAPSSGGGPLWLAAGAMLDGMVYAGLALVVCTAFLLMVMRSAPGEVRS